MTEEDICRLALEFAKEHQLPVSHITAVRRISFQHPTEGPRDLWVVCFAPQAQAGPAEYAREIIVEIRDDTGEARVFGSAPHEEN